MDIVLVVFGSLLSYLTRTFFISLDIYIKYQIIIGNQ